jgi:hypothetical protein
MPARQSEKAFSKKSEPWHDYRAILESVSIPIHQRFEICSLGFFWNLGFDVWDFSGAWFLMFGSFGSG